MYQYPHLPVSSSVPSFVPSKLVAAAASCWRRWQCASIASGVQAHIVLLLEAHAPPQVETWTRLALEP
eukprot:scaffold91329_cov54-Phaeocystis_antarctica.AAC.2